LTTEAPKTLAPKPEEKPNPEAKLASSSKPVEAKN
jgi:hypothetical protein